MAARPIVNNAEFYVDEEKEEFDLLISETSNQHKEKTVQLLNALFATDLEGESATFLIQNRTKCNKTEHFDENRTSGLKTGGHRQIFGFRCTIEVL